MKRHITRLVTGALMLGAPLALILLFPKVMFTTFGLGVIGLLFYWVGTLVEEVREEIRLIEKGRKRDS